MRDNFAPSTGPRLLCASPPTAVGLTSSLGPLGLVALTLILLLSHRDGRAQTVGMGATGGASSSNGTSNHSPSQASADSADETLDTNKNEFGLWVGSSFGLPSALPGSRDRSISEMTAVRYGRVLISGPSIALEYTLDLVPDLIVSGPAGLPEVPPPGATGREHVYGGGFIPVGFKLFLAPQHRIKPYITVSSGAFYFTRQFPIPNSAQFNFLSTAGPGLQVFLSPRRSLSLEYRIGHLSNAGIGNRNPGFNNSMIVLGFSFFK
jgi:hypothetical protein